MNFKPNAWTLLFAITLGGFLFQMMQKPTLVDTLDPSDIAFLESKKNCAKEKSNKLKVDLGTTRHAEYIAYSTFIKSAIDEYVKEDTLAQRVWSEIGVVNPDVFSFKIPTCEMYQMLKEMPAGTSEVYAYMAISPYERNDEKMIDLIFYQEQLSNSSDGGLLVAKGNGDGSFYDFTTPCPPLCF